MPAVQTSYGTNLTPGFPGMLADSSRTKDAVTKAQGEASAEIPFGAVVAQGASEGKAILPAVGTAVLLGVVLHSHDYAKPTELGDTGLKPKTSLSVLRVGRVWVRTETAVAVNDPVHVRYAGAGDKGAVRNAAVVGETIQLVSARFVTAAAAGGLAVLELDRLGNPA